MCGTSHQDVPSPVSFDLYLNPRRPPPLLRLEDPLERELLRLLLRLLLLQLRER